MTIIGQSPAFLSIIDKLPRIAAHNVPVLLQGETGTGKEVVARAIHYLSARHDGPFVAFPCGAIPVDLLENELFGHDAGAYTGASSAQQGIIESVERGTLLLDEVETLPLQSQAKILRLMQESEYRTLGNSRVRRADIRVISACNVDLPAAVCERRFRQDLYFRLAVWSLAIPPLRDRPEDIPLLAMHFLKRFSLLHEKILKSFSCDALVLLLAYQWPGNVRELEHTIHRAVILADGGQVEPRHLELPGVPHPPTFRTFMEAKLENNKRFEREYVGQLLATHEGNVTKASRAAGMDRKSFYRLMVKHNVESALYRQQMEVDDE